MPSNILLARTVLDMAASLMNDTAKTTYTHVVAIPYLNIAMQELQEEFELNSISCTQKTSSEAINVPAGNTEVIFNGPAGQKLPDDLIEPVTVWERTEGVDPYLPMSKREFIPHELAGTPLSNFLIWVWQEQKIKLIESNQDNDIKIDYIGSLFVPVTNAYSPINIINAQTFLEYRTAALLAENVEENTARADRHNQAAILAADRSMGISIKGKQSIQARRRPFRSSYKRMSRIG